MSVKRVQKLRALDELEGYLISQRHPAVVNLSDIINETAFLKLEKYLNEFTARMQEEVKSIMVETDSMPGLVDRLDRIESKLKHDTVTINARLLDLEEDKHSLESR